MSYASSNVMVTTTRTCINEIMFHSHSPAQADWRATNVVHVSKDQISLRSEGGKVSSTGVPHLQAVLRLPEMGGVSHRHGC